VQANAEYRLAPDHSLYGRYTYSTDTTERPATSTQLPDAGWTVGQRWRLSNQVALFNESQLRNGAGEAGVSHLYGMDFFPNPGWTLGFALQESKLDKDAGTVDRQAVSVNGAYDSPGWQWSTKVEWREDRGAEQREQWVTTNAASFRINPSVRIGGRINYSDTRDQLDAAAGATFAEGNVGVAWRPPESTSVSWLGKYAFLYDVSSLAQTGTNTATYDQRTQILSFEGIAHASRPWEFSSKIAYRLGEVREGRMEGQWVDSSATFAAVQGRYEFADRWHAMAEHRWLAVQDGGDQSGYLVGLDRDLGRNLRAGIGYNFTAFSDDLTDYHHDHEGVFFNLVGTF
jgi:hypothetical protein